MAGTTKMEKDAVRRMAGNFDAAGDVLRGVDMALEAAIQLLNTTAFVGMVGGAAVAQYLNAIQPRVKNLSTTCTEMSQKLNDAVSFREQAEEAGDSV